MIFVKLKDHKQSTDQSKQCLVTKKIKSDKSPVHVVLVSLLVDQLSSLFLPFYGRPKKNCSVSGNFWSGSDFFWSTKFLFGIPKFLFSIPKNHMDGTEVQRLWIPSKSNHVTFFLVNANIAWNGKINFCILLPFCLTLPACEASFFN